MDIFKFAKEKEKLAESYYRDLSSKVNDKGLVGIFDMLADEEAKHLRVIQSMEKNGSAEPGETTILADAKEIFQKMRESGDDFDLSLTEPGLYERAQQIEKDSGDFYLSKAQETDNPENKHLFTKLAEEEKKHFVLLENIIQFVSRPQSWLENAEWYHLDKY